MTKAPTTKDLQKILKQSTDAAKIALKNKEIVETLVSIDEIKKGNYKKFASSKELFIKLKI